MRYGIILAMILSDRIRKQSYATSSREAMRLS